MRFAMRYALLLSLAFMGCSEADSVEETEPSAECSDAGVDMPDGEVASPWKDSGIGP